MNRPSCLPLIAVAALAAPCAQVALAGDLLPPASQRFASPQGSEVPDFQRHLGPLLGKLGCNGRSCHGSFQGRGGFQLSLFGYDFDMDHKGLMDRIDTDAPADSYALQKATLKEKHEGGKRMDVGSWEYNLFLKWIQGGAHGVERPAQLAALEVTPSEIHFTGEKQTQQLRAVAVWADGTREDVTCLSRFKTNDDSICGIDDNGLVTSGEAGDSHVVVFYDNAVVPVPVLRPVSGRTGANYPQVVARTQIDKCVIEKLSKLGIVPSEVCSDADFLRRVSLDMTGTLPTAAEVRAFLSDTSPEKRARKVDELLQTPAYAAWWTTQLCDWTGCSNEQLNNVNPASNQGGANDWYAWVYKRVSENVPYDKICEQIILAGGRRPQESYQQYCERMSDYAHDKDKSFADEDGLIYFWGRRNFTKDEDRAIGFAYTFMGTRIQCAQCHKHPFDVWTKKDFEEFERFFSRVRFSRNGSDRDEFNAIVKSLGLDKVRGNDQRKAMEKAVQQGKTIPFPEVVVQQPRNAVDARQLERAKAKAKERGQEFTPPSQTARLLGEQEVDLATIEDPRTALMDWLRNSPTHLFAKALVNRVWANYFGHGIVEPTDDLSLANPPSNAALLDSLVAGLIEHNYDLKWLHREICLSDTYQRSWHPNETNARDERNFSRAVPRRLPAEVTVDALTMATASDAVSSVFRTELKGHATTSPSPPRNALNGVNYVLAVFGRSIRESNCDCDRSSDASLLQTLFVRNDNDTLKMLEDRNGWLQQLAAQASRERGTQSPQAQTVEKLKAELAQLERELKRANKTGDKGRAREANVRIETVGKELRTAQQAAAPVTVKLDVKQTVDEAYLRTLSRFPTPQEREIATAHIKAARDPLAGTKDLMWALINTKEFIINH